MRGIHFIYHHFRKLVSSSSVAAEGLFCLFCMCAGRFTVLAFRLHLPDRTFGRFRASQSVDRRFLCSSEMSFEGFRESKFVRELLKTKAM